MTDVTKNYEENWETIQKKLIMIATEEKDNMNVQKILAVGEKEHQKVNKFNTISYSHL